MQWNEWNTTGLTPLPRVKHSANVVNGNLLILGGMHDFQTITPFEVCILDLENQKWKTISLHGTLPSSRYFHSVSVISKEKLILFGGDDEEDIKLDEIFFFKPSFKIRIFI